MYCGNCGKKALGHEVYCGHCGTRMPVFKKPRKRKGSNNGILIALISIIFVTVIGGFFTLYFSYSNTQETSGFIVELDKNIKTVPNDTLIEFDKIADEALLNSDEYNEGDIIILPPDDEYPNGYARRIVSKGLGMFDSSKYILEKPQVTDIVDKINFSYTHEVTFDDYVLPDDHITNVSSNTGFKVVPLSDVKAASGKFSIGSTGLEVKPVDGGAKISIKGVKVPDTDWEINGSFSIRNLQVKLDTNWNKFVNSRDSLKLTLSTKADWEVDVGLENSFGEIDIEDYSLIRKNKDRFIKFAGIRIPVGGVIGVNFALGMQIKADGSFEFGVKLEGKTDITASLQNFKLNVKNSSKTKVEPYIKLKGKVSVNVIGIRCVADICSLDMVAAFVNIGPTWKAETNGRDFADTYLEHIPIKGHVHGSFGFDNAGILKELLKKDTFKTEVIFWDEDTTKINFTHCLSVPRLKFNIKCSHKNSAAKSKGKKKSGNILGMHDELFELLEFNFEGAKKRLGRPRKPSYNFMGGVFYEFPNNIHIGYGTDTDGSAIRTLWIASEKLFDFNKSLTKKDLDNYFDQKPSFYEDMSGHFSADQLADYTWGDNNITTLFDKGKATSFHIQKQR